MSYFVICDDKDYKFFGTAQITNVLEKEIKVEILEEWVVVQ